MDEAELARLVGAARAHSPEAVASLCEEFYPKVYRFMLHRGARREDAEDLASEVCVRVMRFLPRQKGFFPAWVFRIATNLLTDSYRRAARERKVELTDELAEVVPDPREQQGSVLPHQLARALKKLTPEQREVVHLRFVEGFDAGEIAEVQGRSVGAVRALQFRALEVLRQELAGKARGGNGA